MIRKIIAKAASFTRDALIIGATTVLLLAALEVSLYFHYRRVDSGNTQMFMRVDSNRLRADGYGCAPWIDDYFSEIKQMSFRWEPYVYWRKSAFKGKYVTVDDSGIRRTWNEPAPNSHPLRVWFFGGSTMWGLGVRDEYTIPSLVSQELAKQGIRAEVTNYGQQGYNSTQELIALILLLRNGESPDLAVFYDGVNEVLSAGKQGQAGIPLNEAHRAMEFQSTGLLLAEQNKRVPGYFEDVLARTRIVRFVTELRSKSAGGVERTSFPSASASDFLAAKRPMSRDLSEEVLRVYRFNVATARFLAKRQGAETLAYWQPIPLVHKKRSPFEQYSVDALREDNRAVYDLFLKAYGLVDSLHEAEKFDEAQPLDRIFEGVTTPTYLDFCHLTEEANRDVAARLLRDIVPILVSRAHTAS